MHVLITILKKLEATDFQALRGYTPQGLRNLYPHISMTEAEALVKIIAVVLEVDHLMRIQK